MLRDPGSGPPSLKPSSMIPTRLRPFVPEALRGACFVQLPSPRVCELDAVALGRRDPKDLGFVPVAQHQLGLVLGAQCVHERRELLEVHRRVLGSVVASCRNTCGANASLGCVRLTIPS